MIASSMSALIAVVALAATPRPAAASQADYAKAYAVGLTAYTYGLPLLETNKTFRSMTSINVSDGAFGPVNHFNNVRSLNSPTSKAVVAPGANALSSIAWLDLTHGPQVLHVPKVRGHFFVLALEDPYTEDFRNLGSVHHTKPGYYVIAGPGQHNLSIPTGTHRIDSTYSRVWIIGSTQLKGRNDLANVHRIQDGYTLTPLAEFGNDRDPCARRILTASSRTIRCPRGLQFFAVLGRLLRQFPPPAADRPELRQLATVGIGPGLNPSRNARLNSDTLRGLKAAVKAGPAQIATDARALFLAGFSTHDGYLLGGFGHYGTNYKLRAVISQNGLGAFTSDQSIFALSLTDHSLAPLSGSTNYVLHMPAAPPVNEGWTLTVYDPARVPGPQPAQPLPVQPGLSARAQRRRLGRHLPPEHPAGERNASPELAANPARSGIRADLAAPRPQAGEDHRDPQRQRLGAPRDHPITVTPPFGTVTS